MLPHLANSCLPFKSQLHDPLLQDTVLDPADWAPTDIKHAPSQLFPCRAAITQLVFCLPHLTELSEGRGHVLVTQHSAKHGVGTHEVFIEIKGKLGWDVWVCGPTHVSSLGQSTAEALGAGCGQQVLPGSVSLHLSMETGER